MADFIAFNEGRVEVATNGLPAQCHFLLSTKAVSDLRAADTLASVGEIKGSGYQRLERRRPEPTGSNPTVLSFETVIWSTGVNVGWPDAVRSCVMATPSGKAVCAWNLVGGGARDMSEASTTEQFTPTLTVA